jgi:hypothetical protein
VSTPVFEQNYYFPICFLLPSDVWRSESVVSSSLQIKINPPSLFVLSYNVYLYHVTGKSEKVDNFPTKTQSRHSLSYKAVYASFYGDHIRIICKQWTSFLTDNRNYKLCCYSKSIQIPTACIYWNTVLGRQIGCITKSSHNTETTVLAKAIALQSCCLEVIMRETPPTPIYLHFLKTFL